MVLDWFFGNPIHRFRGKIKAAEATAKKAIKDISHDDLKGMSQDIQDLIAEHNDLKDRLEGQRAFLRGCDDASTEKVRDIIVLQEQALEKAKDDAGALLDLVKEGTTIESLDDDIKGMGLRMVEIEKELKKMESLMQQLRTIKEKKEKEAKEQNAPEEVKEKVKSKQFIRATERKETDEYGDALKGPYKEHEDDVRRIERNIREWPSYSERLHELIQAGPYAGHRHANVTRNLVMIYDVKKDTIIFERLVMHNEFDQICR
jgi:mRNA-degrading endonuclease YafQ of YafQ-DinJ toxin-antitoxin module/RNA binding exosome subunit